jgi:Permuted papain-like amidase enzyme, YaeF/YiiX, C92 family
MGIVLLKNGKPFVFEAVATVRYTPLQKWIKRGKDSHFVVKRLTNAAEVLTPANIARLHQSADTFEGKPYYLTFEWSDTRIYCSELVWKMYQKALGLEIGKIQRLREFRLDDPVVRQKLKERYGDRIPLDEPVISPVAMFNSTLLQVVAQE